MSRRGIVLLTALIFCALLSMVLLAAVSLFPSSARMSENVSDRLAAEAAAESGLQYALAKLKARPSWKGDDGTVEDRWPALYVQEDQGNVIGLLQSSTGRVSAFRIRFNYQDGAGTSATDALDDPAQLDFEHPYVSVNNLLSGSARPVPRADGPGFSVTPTSATPTQAAPFSVCLLVEGRAGRALRELSPTSFEVASGSLATRVLEATYRISSLQSLDAAASAGSEIVVNSAAADDHVRVKALAGVTPRIRSKSNIKITAGTGDGKYISPNGEVRRPSGSSFQADYNAGQVDVVDELAADPFYQIKWDQVKKADPEGAKMPAGTYVWWNTSPPSLHYYDMDYTDYVTWVQADPSHKSDPGQIVGSDLLPPAGVQVDPDTRSLTLTQSLNIEPTLAGTKDFSVIPREGAPEDPAEKSEVDADVIGGFLGGVNFQPAKPEMNENIFTFYQAVLQWSSANGGTNSPDMPIKDVPGWPFGGDPIIDMGAGDPQAWTFEGTGPASSSQVAWLATQMAAQGGPPISTWASLFNLSGGGGPPGNLKELGLGTGDTLKAADLAVNIEAPPGESAVLSAEGSVRLGASLHGTGASITAGDQIRITGQGVDLTSNPNAAEGVSLYGRGDIVLSTLHGTAGSWSYQDYAIRGVMYSWGNIYAKLNHSSVNDARRFSLKGALVAYGGNVDINAPPGASGGEVKLDVADCELTFDPAYVTQLLINVPNGARYSRVLYAWVR